MKANVAKDTVPELAIRRFLHASGYRYRLHVRPDAKLNRRADIVFRKAQVAVFVDGCFWHGCPLHFVEPKTNPEYWRSKIARNRIRDEETTKALRKSGWKVVRVWEHQAPSAAAARIRRVVDEKLSDV